MKDLLALLAEKGFKLVPDFNNVFHRFDRSGTLNAWFVGHSYQLGDKKLLTARFGDWRTDERYEWRSEDLSQLPETERVHYEETLKSAQGEEAKEKQARQEQSAQECKQVWDAECFERGAPPYIVKKGIDKLYGARTHTHPSGLALVVPAKDTAGKLWGLQKILPDGTKSFYPGMRIKSCFHTLGSIDPSGTVFVTEGFSTAASVHMATGTPVVSSFNAGNLESVCTALRSHFGESLRIVVAGDDDRHTVRPDGTPYNPGREKALRAARAVGAPAHFPRFRDPLSRHTDWNDLHLSEGIDAVKEQLDAEPENMRKNNEDYFAAGPGSELIPLPWHTPKGTKAPKPPEHQKVIERLLEYYGDNIVRQEDDIFLYSGTHWKLLKTEELDIFIRQFQILYSGKATYGKLQEMFKLFKANLPSATVNMSAPRPTYVNFLDGTLVLSRGSDYKWTKVFREHQRRDFLINCIPLEYKKAAGATNPAFTDMLQRVFEGDPDRDQKIRAVRQMYGACLAPLKPHLFLLHGPSGSGKTSLIIPAMRLVHQDNWCSIQPHEFTGFLMESMVGKLVNFRSDINISQPIDDDTIKMIEDQVAIRVDRKFKVAVKAPLPAIHIFGANGIPPTLEGSSGAHTRRWTFIQLSAHKTRLGEYMQDFGNWVFDQSPEGVLAFALEGLEDLLRVEHYLTPDSGLAEIESWQRMHDPVGQFIHECGAGEVVDNNTQVKVGPNWRIEKPRLWIVFTDWWKMSSQRSLPISRYKFYDALRDKGFKSEHKRRGDLWIGVGTQEAETSEF